MVSNRRGSDRDFFRDLVPYFSYEWITYVDVGAFRGEMLLAALDAGLKVEEAHLYEPNPTHYEEIVRNVPDRFPGRSLNVYNLALASREGVLTLRDNGTMSRVSSRAPVSSNDLEVECTTLDSASEGFTEGKVSLLKIDVEGYELEVLSGARDLLERQVVQVLYLEAGFNPGGRQHVHWREVEEPLLEQGYRLFGIYEQQHEWMDDSPFLRRANFAFMSESFAKDHPHRLVHELHELRDELVRERATRADVADQVVALKEHVGRLEQELRELRRTGNGRT